jgi:hypothetical protein
MRDDRKVFVKMIVDLLNEESDANLLMTEEFGGQAGIVRTKPDGSYSTDDWINLEGYNTLGILRRIMSSVEDIS